MVGVSLRVGYSSYDGSNNLSSPDIFIHIRSTATRRKIASTLGACQPRMRDCQESASILIIAPLALSNPSPNR